MVWSGYLARVTLSKPVKKFEEVLMLVYELPGMVVWILVEDECSLECVEVLKCL